MPTPSDRALGIISDLLVAIVKFVGITLYESVFILWELCDLDFDTI